MTVFLHELKRNRLALSIWTLAITFMLAVSIFIYPEMAGEMEGLGDLFANMGSFSDAFGMDQLNFGEFMGYFGIECGNTLGIGGALFASILGIAALAKEEKDGTAEFLLTHPLSRTRVFFEKALAMLAEILFLNLTVLAASALCATVIGAEVKWPAFFLLLLSHLLLQIELGLITLGLSAFLRGNGLGLGMGLSLLLYFLNILSNLTKEVKFLKYFTPFSYVDSAHIVNNCTLEWKYLLPGLLLAALVLAIGWKKYTVKDIS